MTRDLGVVLALLGGLLLFAFSGAAKPRVALTGIVADRQEKTPMEYLTVMVLDTSNQLVSVGLTDKQGRFELQLKKTGNYTVQFSAVGIAPYKRKWTYTGGEQCWDTVYLTSGLELKAVLVRPLFRKESDRLVYDAYRDPDAARLKMVEMMAKIPDLKMDPGTGKLEYRNVKPSQILIDGKPNAVISENRQYSMSFLYGDVMRTIEIIPPGSPEYGNTQLLINIKLQKEIPLGFAAEVNASAQSSGAYAGHLDGITKTPWGAFGISYFGQYTQTEALEERKANENLLNQGSVRKTLSESSAWKYDGRQKAEMDYAWRESGKNKLNFRVRLGGNWTESVSHLRGGSKNYDAQEVLMKEKTNAARTEIQSPFDLNGVVYASYDFSKNRKTSKELVFIYLAQVTNSASGTSRWLQTDTMTDLSRTHHDARTTNHNLRLNYYQKFLRFKGTLKGGIGFTSRHFVNSTQSEDIDPITGAYVLRQEELQGLDYWQRYGFAHVGLMYHLHPKLFMQTTLNGELYGCNGSFVHTQAGTLDHQEVNLLPNVNLTWNIGSWNLSTRYTAMVKRPNANQLNPYRDESNPTFIRVGNPELRGSYTHNISISPSVEVKIFTFPTFISVKYSLTASGNSIVPYQWVDQENRNIVSYANLGKYLSQTALLEFSPTFSKQLSLTLNAGAGWQQSVFADGSDNANLSFNGGGSINYSFSKEGRCSLDCSYSPFESEVQSVRNTNYVSMNFKADYYNAKIKLGGSFQVRDLLNSHRFVKKYTGGPGFSLVEEREVFGRTFALSLFWRFGKFQRKSAMSVEAQVYD